MGVGRRNQMCNLSSLKQFTILHWSPAYKSLNRKDLVRKDGCIRKNTSVFQKMDRSRSPVDFESILSCAFPLAEHLQLWCFIMQGHLNSMFLKWSVACYISAFVYFVLHRGKHNEAPKLRKPLWLILFTFIILIMMEEVQFFPTKKSICVSCWGQKCPVWCYPRATRIPPCSLITQLQHFIPACKQGLGCLSTSEILSIRR